MDCRKCIISYSTVRTVWCEFEEETVSTDTHQFSLEERIAFLAEFVRTADLPPPPTVILPVLPQTSEVDTHSDPGTT